MTSLQVNALGILIAFYFGYFYKKVRLEKKGIQIDYMGKGKKPYRTQVIEQFLKVATFSIVPVEIFSIIRNTQWFESSLWGYMGLILAFLGTLLFYGSMYFMGDNWRAGVPSHNPESLIVEGLYKYTRNPAFLGFDMMYIGIFFAFPNRVLFLFTCFVLITLHLQILEEEKYMALHFGEAYKKYTLKTPRYLLFK